MNGGQEYFEDVKETRDPLLLHIHQSAKIFEFEEELGYNTNPPSHSQIKAQEVIADWNLSYHQGRTLEYIYQSLFEYGRVHRFSQSRLHLIEGSQSYRYKCYQNRIALEYH
jgi:hypothetical protein